MSAFEIIIFIVGIGLLVLGSFSAYALLNRALKLSDKFGDETNIGTLWGLFLVGMSFGLLLIWWSLP